MQKHIEFKTLMLTDYALFNLRELCLSLFHPWPDSVAQGDLVVSTT